MRAIRRAGLSTPVLIIAWRLFSSDGHVWDRLFVPVLEVAVSVYGFLAVCGRFRALGELRLRDTRDRRSANSCCAPGRTLNLQ